MSSASAKPSSCLSFKAPWPHTHLESTHVHHGRPQAPKRRRFKLALAKKVDSLSVFKHVPVDIFYEILMYLHPQDLLNLSRSTHRLRELLMTRNARFVWMCVLFNVEGLPPCPSDLCEPQFANLTFDEHCHFCLAPKVRSVLWRCRVRSCNACLPKCFLTIGQLAVALPKTLDIPRLETIFPNVTYPHSDKPEMVMFYKPRVELYLRELAEISKGGQDVSSSSLLKWCIAKRSLFDEIVAHASMCEHWSRCWDHSRTSYQLSDFAVTLCLIGLLVFLWKDTLFY